MVFSILFKPQKTNNRVLTAIFLISILGLALIIQWVLNLSEPKIAQGVTLEGVKFGGLNVDEADEQLRAMASLKVKWPQDARFLDEETLQEGVKGRIIAVEETLQSLRTAPPDAKLKLNTYSIEPMVKVEEIASLRYGLVTAQEFHYLEGENYNLLKQAINQLYNQVIYPGEEFSLNSFLTFCQDPSEYPQAVTQLLARSLYHCIKRGGLQITEKWESQEPKVGSTTTDNISIGLGRDLKFINNLNQPILIRSSLDREVFRMWFLTSKTGAN